MPSGGGGGSSIPQYEDSDPSPLVAESAWVKHTTTSGGGTPIGLLLALTYAGSGTEKWELSYYTTQGSIKRIELV